MTVRILTGDVRDMLATLPDESVHCVVTSPPYWALRSYLPDDHPDKPREIGSEATMGQHIETMVDVFREVRRVLRKDGTVWLNYGDCYANDTKWGGSSGGKHVTALHGSSGPGRLKSTTGLKPKDLCMIPNRLAIALQDDGWWVRSEIIWAKPNPMPESVTDRPATAHEKIWLLSKSARYFYDAEAVRTASDWNPDKTKMPDGWDTGPGAHGTVHRNGREKGRKTDKQRGVPKRQYAGFNDRWDAKEANGEVRNGANLRNVWTIPTKGFSGAHYATFPPDLIMPCIKAGTSEKGCCGECGAAWVRETDKYRTLDGERCDDLGPMRSSDKQAPSTGQGVGHWRTGTSSQTLGWSPSCECTYGDGSPIEPIPCTVLDPFIGSGTTAMVADRLGRDCIGVDLNPANVEMATERLVDDAGLFAEVAQ